MPSEIPEFSVWKEKKINKVFRKISQRSNMNINIYCYNYSHKSSYHLIVCSKCLLNDQRRYVSPIAERWHLVNDIMHYNGEFLHDRLLTIKPTSCSSNLMKVEVRQLLNFGQSRDQVKFYLKTEKKLYYNVEELHYKRGTTLQGYNQ